MKTNRRRHTGALEITEMALTLIGITNGAG